VGPGQPEVPGRVVLAGKLAAFAQQQALLGERVAMGDRGVTLVPPSSMLAAALGPQ